MFTLDEAAKKRLVDLTKDEENAAEINEISNKASLKLADIEQITKLVSADTEIYKFLLMIRPIEVKEVRPPPTKEYLERIERLKMEQEKAEYEHMISTVDASQNYGSTSLMKDFGKELKESNRQVIGVVNMMITVFGGFMFGFFGIGMAYPSLNMSTTTRTVLGLAIATIFFMVDLYFFVKTLDLENEEVKSDKTLFKLDTNQVGKVLDGADSTSATKDDVKKPKVNFKNKKRAKKTD
ncbi:unnamed protein product [Bursaphelenchus okinawaensis]|uniref:Transmembrane protein 199 n=1 Tax=Bursaphelenchus okinawaensis TaxID=465554 RepID=A0A811JW02_9BILA|nr:unnamed protein product [Bursaphelenchus okinawaensis]CAG9086320.1 unnamed protein product [Bursaphelenchus okinawaensis]